MTILSPTLFALYIDDLVEGLKEKGVGWVWELHALHRRYSAYSTECE